MESGISADQAKKKMPRNARSTRQTEYFPASNNFKREGDAGEMRRITREQGTTTNTPDITGLQNDDYIEGQKMSGDTAAAPTLLIDIILPRLGLLCFSGQVCIFVQGDPNFRRLEF
jgi:hypothetical protein